MRLKLVRSARWPAQAPVAFAEFESVELAAAARAALAGAVLLSSDRGGIRCQFSRAPFGIKPHEEEEGPAAQQQHLLMPGAPPPHYLAAGHHPHQGAPLPPPMPPPPPPPPPPPQQLQQQQQLQQAPAAAPARADDGGADGDGDPADVENDGGKV